MSSEFSVFMKGEAKTLLLQLEAILGCSFEPPSSDCGGARHAEVLEVALTFADSHGIVDDMGIPFEAYPLSVEFARSGSQSEPELRDALCRVLALLCGRLLAERGYADTMVVRDLQEIVERHELAPSKGLPPSQT